MKNIGKIRRKWDRNEMEKIIVLSFIWILNMLILNIIKPVKTVHKTTKTKFYWCWTKKMRNKKESGLGYQNLG